MRSTLSSSNKLQKIIGWRQPNGPCPWPQWLNLVGSQHFDGQICSLDLFILPHIYEVIVKAAAGFLCNMWNAVTRNWGHQVWSIDHDRALASCIVTYRYYLYRHYGPHWPCRRIVFDSLERQTRANQLCPARKSLHPKSKLNVHTSKSD